MITLLTGAALLGLLWWLSGVIAGKRSRQRLLWATRAGGVLVAGIALVMVLRGRLDMALAFGLAAGALFYGGPRPSTRSDADLDGQASRGREHAQRHADPRMVQPAPAMTEEQAYQVLGLQPGAGHEAVVESHRRLMKRVHPDSGGSAELAARVNQARDVLLRHR